jgi:hypothetical protein
MAANLLYPRTWMLHHLGVDRGVRADRTAFLSCVRELYSAALHGTEHVSEPEFLTLYVEADKGFTDFLYGNFARMYGRSGDLQWSHNYVFRADTRRDRPAAEPGDPAIRVATRDDLELLAASCARTRTPMEIRAHELDPEGLSAEGFARRLSPRRPVRARETYVFAAGGRATWAVVCETGSEGANVFGLLNRCWLAELSPRAGTDEPGARRALLRRAIRHFSDAGRRQVVLLAPDARWLADAEGAGFEFVSKGAVWLSRWAVTPAWLAYVHDALSLPRSAAWRAA